MAGVLIGLELLLLVLVEVLPRICGLIFEHLDELIETRSNKCSKDGANPVDLYDCQS